MNFQQEVEILGHTYVDSDSKIPTLIEKIQKVSEIGFDVEGSGLDPHSSTLLLYQINTGNDIYVVNVGKVAEKLHRYLFELIKDRNIEVIGHNIKFDVKMIYGRFGILLENIFDTMLGEVLAFPGINDPFTKLDTLIKKYTGHDIKKEIRSSFIGKIDFEFTDEQIEYAAIDVAFLFLVKGKLLEKLEERKQMKVWELERSLEPMVAMMEFQGVGLDRDLWMKLYDDALLNRNKAKEDLYQYLIDQFDLIAGKYKNALDIFNNLEIKKLEGRTVTAKFRQENLKALTVRDEIVPLVVKNINLDSNAQVFNIIQKLNLQIKNSNAKELDKVKTHPFVARLLTHRHHSKRADTFGEEFLVHINPVTGKIHSEFNQLRAGTGRFSSDGPNLQQTIAEEAYRRAFIASHGYLLGAYDYDQIELRTMAEVSHEQVMINAFLNSEDLHILTASIIFNIPIDQVTTEQRRVGKTMNFAVIYGSTEHGLLHNFGFPLDQGREYLARFFDKYSTMAQFIDAAGMEILKRKYSTTLLGRRRYFTLDNTVPAFHWEAKYALQRIKRQGINHIVQGSCADIMKLAMIFLWSQNPFGYENLRALITVHDELVVEFKQDIQDEAHPFIMDCMKKAGEHFLKVVPVEVGYKIDTYWRKE